MKNWNNRSAWSWFRSYLLDWQHYVSISSHSSSILQVLYGVPQRSILGPLLFIIVTNDIPEAIPYLSTYIFADSTKLIKSFVKTKVTHYCYEMIYPVQNLGASNGISGWIKWNVLWRFTLANSTSQSVRHHTISTILKSALQISTGTLVSLSMTNFCGLTTAIKSAIKPIPHFIWFATPFAVRVLS